MKLKYSIADNPFKVKPSKWEVSLAGWHWLAGAEVLAGGEAHAIDKADCLVRVWVG